MNQYCLALDLKDDPARIARYEEHHRKVWPEILKSMRDAGITGMQIYRVSNRLFMIMQTNASFSFDQKARMDSENEAVQRWEELMWNYQQAIPGSAPGEKWRLMECIFDLEKAGPS